jgi:hypothetical protein
MRLRVAVSGSLSPRGWSELLCPGQSNRGSLRCHAAPSPPCRTQAARSGTPPSRCCSRAARSPFMTCACRIRHGGYRPGGFGPGNSEGWAPRVYIGRCPAPPARRSSSLPSRPCLFSSSALASAESGVCSRGYWRLFRVAVKAPLPIPSGSHTAPPLADGQVGARVDSCCGDSSSASLIWALLMVHFDFPSSPP